MQPVAKRGRPPANALPTLAAALALLLGPVVVRAADPVSAGYTRPGSPGDRVVGGKVVHALNNPQARKNAFGGTVYFLVLERTGDAGDPWGVGLKDFDSRFRLGIDFAGASSPTLDTGAKYLYLYQVVNDRRTLAPIESASVELLVEMKDITSWGYFHGVGFATSVHGAEKRGAIRPVSVGNVLGEATELLYREYAPAIPAPSPFRLVPVPTLRGEKAPAGFDVKKVVNVVWDPLDPASDPDHVMLLGGSDFGQKPSVRAIWSGKDVLAKEVRSTVFGFTSNLPPTLEAVHLRALRLDAKGQPIRLAVAADGLPADGREAQVSAAGHVPTPKPEFAASGGGPGMPPPFPGVGAPAGGGMPGLAGGSPGFGGVAPVGGIGGAGVPFLGGGGGSGSGSGSGGGTSVAGTATASSTNTNQGQSTQQPTQTQLVVVNPTFANQNQQSQQQQQGQAQAQAQAQQQSQQPGCPCEPVPEPPAVLLAALALPLLVLLRCRTQRPPRSPGRCPPEPLHEPCPRDLAANHLL